jgi:hypothetical protein
MQWASYPRETTPRRREDGQSISADFNPPFAVQLVRQVNYGPLESKRYFIPTEGEENEFVEIVEDELIRANFQKLNSWVYCLHLLAIIPL